MPWCPKCKNEYREGITICADCGCELMEEYSSTDTNDKVTLIFGEEDQMYALKKFLEYNGLEDVHIRYDSEEEVYELLVSEADKGKASRIAYMFLEKEAEQQAGKTPDEPDTEDRDTSHGIYQDSAERAQDNRSSAWVLLLVGGAGMAVMILGMMGVLPINLTGNNKYMVYGVMTALFLLFIVMGVISMKNSRIFAKKAESENSLRETLRKWCQESLDPENLDAELLLGEDVTDEVLYFKRFEKMKEKLNHQFVNLDQAFLENFIDEIYDSVFNRSAV